MIQAPGHLTFKYLAQPQKKLYFILAESSSKEKLFGNFSLPHGKNKLGRFALEGFFRLDQQLKVRQG